MSDSLTIARFSEYFTVRLQVFDGEGELFLVFAPHQTVNDAGLSQSPQWVHGVIFMKTWASHFLVFGCKG